MYVYRHGSAQVENRPHQVVGTDTQFSWPAKGRITVKHVADFGTSTSITVRGVKPNGQRIVEFLTIKGAEPSLTNEEFSFLESLEVRGGKEADVDVVAYDVDNKALLQITAGMNKSFVPWVYAPPTAKVSVLGFGACCEPLTSKNDVEVRLTLYDDKGNETLKTLHLFMGSRDEHFIFAEPLLLPAGTIAAVEAKLSEDDSLVEAFLELNIE